MLVLIGVFITISMDILHVPVIAFAIGLYLPVQISAGVMAGGLVRLVLEKSKEDEERKKEKISSGTLYCASMIAAEGLIGILLAVFALIPFGGQSFGQWLGTRFNLTGLPGSLSPILELYSCRT